MPTYRGLAHFVYAAMEGMPKACKRIKAKKQFFCFYPFASSEIAGLLPI